MSATFTYTQVRRVTPKGGSIVGNYTAVITGFGFNFATGGVTFGGVAATNVSIDSNTQITVTVPSHASGAVDVVVAGVGTGVGIFTYQNPSVLLLPRVPVSPDNSLELDTVGAVKWLMEVKKRIETAPIIDATSVVGGEPLTGVSDTNVTVTLTGTPLEALLRPVTLTLGWTGALAPTRGGTGLQSYVTGDLLYASSALVLARLADVSVGSYLRSGGVATAPLWSTLKLPNAANSGDILKASSANVYASVAPQALTKTDDTNVTLTLGGTPATALVNAASLTLGWTGTLAVARGGTNIASYAVGDLLYASGATTLSKLADVAAGSYLRSGGVTTAPVWSTLTLPNSAATGDLLYGSSANTMSLRTIGSSNDVLTVSGGVPVWSAAASVATNVTITDDTTTNATMYPTWVTAASGNLPVKVASTKLTFNPSTGTLTVPLAVHATSTSTPSLISTGAVTVTPAAGSNLNVSLSTTGDFAVNTNQLYVDTSAAFVGINTSSPGVALDIIGATAQLTNTVTPQFRINLSTGTGSVGSMAFYEGVTQKATIQYDGSAVGTVARRGQMTFDATRCVFTPNRTLMDADATLTSTRSLRIGKAANASTGIELLANSTTWFIDHRGSADATNNRFMLGTDATNNVLVALRAGQIGIATGSPTAMLHLPAGTTAASTAPLKLTSGTSMTTAEAGAIEFTTDDFFATITTGAARKAFVLDDGTRLTSGRVPFATTNGRLTDDSDMTFATDTLTITKVAVGNKITSYNAVATAGQGVPSIYGSGRSAAATAAVASVAAYTNAATDGSFLVAANVLVTTSTTHNFTAAVDYTDEGNTARTLTLSFTLVAGGALVTAVDNANGAVPYMGVPQRIRCKASTAITIKTVGTFTTVTYNVEGSIIQIA